MEIQIQNKYCSCCKQTKTTNSFTKNRARYDGLATYCKECRHKINKERYQRNIPIHRNAALKKNYGITLEDWNKMFEEQHGCCAICGTHQSELDRKLSVDHNHDTGEIRSLLCDACNQVIGRVKENIIVLLNMIDYLKKHDATSSDS